MFDLSQLFSSNKSKAFVPQSKAKIVLGAEVVDVVSGFRGVAVSEHNYLNGCTRITVQPKIGADGKLPDTASFDSPQLVSPLETQVIKGDTSTGGPEKYVPSKRSEGGSLAL